MHIETDRLEPRRRRDVSSRRYAECSTTFTWPPRTPRRCTRSSASWPTGSATIRASSTARRASRPAICCAGSLTATSSSWGMRPTPRPISPGPGPACPIPRPVACCAEIPRCLPWKCCRPFGAARRLVIFKSPLVSTVRRSARYDCVTVVPPPTGGEGQTVHVFLGLITTLEDGTVARVPVVRKRIAEILLRSGVPGQQPHRTPAAGRVANLAPGRAARGPDRRSAAAGPAGRGPGRAGCGRRLRPGAPQPRFRQRAGVLPGRSFRPGDPAPGGGGGPRPLAGRGRGPRRPDRRAGLRPDAVPDRLAPGRSGALAGSSAGRIRGSSGHPPVE